MRNGVPMVTLLYAGLLALMFVVMAWRVVQLRRSSRTSLGDGGHAELQRVVRGHGNFTEYVPLALLLLGLLELGRVSIYVLHALGLVLLVARILHAGAFSFGPGHRFKWRVWGAGLTFAVLLVEGALCLAIALRAHWAWFAL